MTEKKIEVLFNEAVIVSNQLEANLKHFDQNNTEIKGIYSKISELTSVINTLAQYDDDLKSKQAQKFANEISTQINRYYEALKHVNLDTTSIEKIISQYNIAIQKQASRLETSAANIENALDEHSSAIIATAKTLKKKKRDFMWDIFLLGVGVVGGALFLAVYPITKATKTFHDELVKRDIQIQQLKEQYETNSKMITFLKANDITVRLGTTDDSWNRASLRFAPMLLFERSQIGVVDSINNYKRIIFKKSKERI